MFFLHDSVKTDHFKSDKKLALLQKGMITPTQFINLIDQRDEYMMIGPAVVAKNSIKDFILEWKMKQLHIDAVKTGRYSPISQEEFIDKLDDLTKVFPEIFALVVGFKEELKTAICPKCTKKRYIGLITQKIKILKDDGRDLSSIREFMDMLEMKFNDDALNETDEEILSNYDIEWIKPEIIDGIGYDLIDNLSNCFECSIKHIGRAKILYEEFLTGYPDHKSLSFDELDKGTKPLEQLYLIYLDSMSQLDMASSELIGDMINLPRSWAIEMIELANEIRLERINCQKDPNNAPDFDGLRIKAKKLELKTKNQMKDENSETSSFENK